MLHLHPVPAVTNMTVTSVLLVKSTSQFLQWHTYTESHSSDNELYTFDTITFDTDCTGHDLTLRF